MKTASKNLVVFYDHPCLDGATSAWVLRRALEERAGWTVTYVPLCHGKPMDRTRLILHHLHTGDEAIFLDTSPKNDTLKALIEHRNGEPRIKKLTIFDHHRSEVQRLYRLAAEYGMQPGAPRSYNRILFDFRLDREKSSAAQIIWDHYFPHKTPPELLSFVGKMEPPITLQGDRDFSIAAYIDSQPIDTPERAFETVGRLIAMPFDDMATQGAGIYVAQKRRLEEEFIPTLRYAHLELAPDQWEWVPVFKGNIRSFGRPVGAVLNDAAREAPNHCGVSGAYFEDASGIVHLSLRSNDTPDVGQAASSLEKSLGGVSSGGHACAAVVQLDRKTFDRIEFSDTRPLSCGALSHHGSAITIQP